VNHVLLTTQLSRLTHVGCSLKLLRNVVFPCLCLVKECGIFLLSQRDVMPNNNMFLSPVWNKQIWDGGWDIVSIGPG
jgi:hypothetical protein